MEGVLDLLGRMGTVLERHDQSIVKDKRGQTLIEKFVKLNPPKFDGSTKPEEAEKWIKELEKIFKVFPCSEKEKVDLAEYQMEGMALYWWEAMKPAMFPEGMQVTWSAFTASFFEKYFSEVARDKKLNEFMQLKQGSMTVEEYEARFAELSRFALLIVTNPTEKAKWFMKGLNMDVKKQLSVLGPLSYTEIYSRAQHFEQLIMEEKDEKKEKKKEPEQGSQGEGSKGKRPLESGRRSFVPSKRSFGRFSNYSGGRSSSHSGQRS